MKPIQFRLAPHFVVFTLAVLATACDGDPNNLGLDAGERPAESAPTFNHVPPANAVLGVTNDAWDVSNGTSVTANTGTLFSAPIAQMFGGSGGAIPLQTLFGDGRAAGAVHAVEWRTTQPQSIARFSLHAAHDGHNSGSPGPQCKLPGFPNNRDANHRGFNHFKLTAWNSTTSAFDIILYDQAIALGNDNATHPGENALLYDPQGLNPIDQSLLVLESAVPVTSTDRWRAEFTQVGCPSAESGPRIWELDGFVAATNAPPAVGADADPIVVEEGANAANTGTVSDPDGDAVALSSTIGAVTNNNDGTWSWSFSTSDGPAESQTVTIDADDGNGGTAQTSFALTVQNVAPSVDAVTLPTAPVAIADQPVTAGGTFTDPAGANDEAYGCTVDHGDGSGPLGGTVVGGVCTGPAHTYASAGVYPVIVTVTDKDGDSGDLQSEAFIVIFDPTGGFVTGGGWIDSPAGAYIPGPSLSGKANFGFVSKYKKGASIPTGNTEFQFKAGDMNFRSSTYDWLVINQAGSNAQFKGWGTINGQFAPYGGAFRFMLWAGDDDPDTFRIKIWYENGGEVLVYDNGVDQVIGGGSIVVHKAK